MPPKVTRPVLKSYFPKGGKPTSAQFGSLIDSVFNFAEDTGLLGLNNYDPALSYNTGDTVIEASIIYQANKTTGQGPFVGADWNRIAGGTSGSLLFKGPWDADDDDPQLASPTPIPLSGEFYVVSVAGNTSLSGITDWEIGDWAISAGTQWFKIDNSDFVTTAQNTGTGEGIFSAKVGTVIQLRSLTDLDGSITITPDTDTIDLSVAFDDAGNSLTRSKSAFYIDSQLATKEPVITPSGNAGDYWNGLKAFSDFGTSARNTLLSGLSLATNQVISSTDSVIQAFGYLQKQISDTASNFAVNVRNTTLTGLNLATNQVISANDTIIQAFGYLQKQISDLLATVTSHIGNTSNPHNVTKAQVGLSEVPNLKQNLSAIVNPTGNDDSAAGYAIGSTWINITARKTFICTGSTLGFATWVETSNLVPSPFGNDYLRIESTTPISTTVTIPAFANYNYPPATPAGTFVLQTGNRTGTYRLEWQALIQTGTRAGQFQIKNITSAGPQVVGTVDVEGKTTSDIIPVSWAGDVILTGISQNFVIQFNTQLAGQPVTIHRAEMRIYKVSNAS